MARSASVARKKPWIMTARAFAPLAETSIVLARRNFGAAQLGFPASEGLQNGIPVTRTRVSASHRPLSRSTMRVGGGFHAQRKNVLRQLDFQARDPRPQAREGSA